MKALLDTHLALWYITGETARLGTAAGIIDDPDNDVFFSQVSVWELAIKHQKRPDLMPMSEEEFFGFCEQAGFDYLEIKNEHLYEIKNLKQKSGAGQHHDPFDRLLLAQAKQEGFTYLTHDRQMEEYEEKILIV